MLSRVPIPLCVALKAIQIGLIEVFLNWSASFIFSCKKISNFRYCKESWQHAFRYPGGHFG